MDELKQMRTFIKVVESGGFSAAARNASSVSSITRQIQALEEELGARLLNRNSRRLMLTEAGESLYERAQAIVRDVDNVKSEIKSLQETVKGVLRVQLRIAAGMTAVVPALPKLLETYPDLELDITLTDERRDLIANKIDVAMWLGELPDSDLIARRLAPSQRIVCASRAYLEKNGTPIRPEDLNAHQCMMFTAPSYGAKWTFKKGAEITDVAIRGSLKGDNGLVLVSSALADLGLIVVQEYIVRAHLAQGTLVKVLEEYTVNPHPNAGDLYAVFPSNRGLSRKVRAFVEFLVQVFKEAA